MRRAVGAGVLFLALMGPGVAAAQGAHPDARTRPAPAPAVRAPEAGRLLEIAGFAHIGWMSLAARQSFDAILGSSSGRVAGGGAEVAFRRGPLRRVFARVDASRFRESGQRVFVLGREVFGLGIPETITLMPIEFTAGYRYTIVRRGKPGQPSRLFPVVPYAGLGIGSLRYRETSAFAEAGDNVDERFTSYHALAGGDLRLWRGLSAGIEGVYRWVPDALGASGVSAAFNETNLDGATARVRIRAAW